MVSELSRNWSRNFPDRILPTKGIGMKYFQDNFETIPRLDDHGKKGPKLSAHIDKKFYTQPKIPCTEGPPLTAGPPNRQAVPEMACLRSLVMMRLNDLILSAITCGGSILDF